MLFVAKKSSLLKLKNLIIFQMISLKMNKIIKKYLLTRNKFIQELHLKQPEFTYSACGPFIKHREKNQNFRETGNL